MLEKASFEYDNFILSALVIMKANYLKIALKDIQKFKFYLVWFICHELCKRAINSVSHDTSNNTTVSEEKVKILQTYQTELRVKCTICALHIQ